MSLQQKYYYRGFNFLYRSIVGEGGWKRDVLNILLMLLRKLPPGAAWPTIPPYFN